MFSRAVALALFLFPTTPTAASFAGTEVNIHVKLSAEAFSAITAENIHLTSQFRNSQDQEIDFVTKHDPHVTLYLTTFENSSVSSGALHSAAALALASAASSSPSCSSSSPPHLLIGASFAASGAYGMLSVALTDCLQLLSDSVVNATSTFVTPEAKASVPSWIYDLPEDQQQAKVDMVHSFGSPNVFSAFQPHVTLLADAANTTELLSVASSNEVASLSSSVGLVGFGAVGPFGTVLKGEDVMPPAEAFGADVARSKTDLGLVY